MFKFRKSFKKEEPDVLPTLIETNIVIEPVPIKENVKPKIGRKVVRVRTDEQINNEILSFLKLSNTPQNTQAVANKVNIRHTSTKNRLRFMEFSGLVESYEKGQWVYWKIKRS